MIFKLPKIPKLPHLPQLNIEPVRKILTFLLKHKIAITLLISLIAFITVAMWYRGYLLSKMQTTVENSSPEIFNSNPADNPGPTLILPSPSENNVSIPNNSGSYNSNSYDNTIPTPFPTFAPLPTIAPYVAPATPPTTTTSSTNNGSGNSHCTTGSGVPNSYYSDVYPNPPITTNTGSVDLIIDIRDCNPNMKNAPVSDKLSISLSSGDSNTLINGNKLPYSITTQNGEAKFTVTSQVVGIVTLVVHDDTSNFMVTNVKNDNPSITFTNNSSGNSTGNSHCTTANGVANSWYSDVYLSPSNSVSTGSTVTLTVKIRDCSQNLVSSDNLTLTQTSNDSNLNISPSANAQAQNGLATFTVTSTNAGTDTFKIQDTTGNFTVTDTSDSNPSVTFTGSSATPTPAPTNAPSATDTPTPTLSPSPSDTPALPPG